MTATRLPEPIRTRSLVRMGLPFFILTLLWEFVGHSHFAARVLPPPTAIIEQLWTDRLDYAEHIPATLGLAALGFFLGNSFAILIALLLCQSRLLDRISEGLLISVFSTPLLILVLIVDSSCKDRVNGAIIFTALTVFFPTLENVKIGLLGADKALLEVVRTAGGRGLSELAKVRLRSTLPNIAASLQVAFPVAILGAMLSDFTGAERGLGKYLAGSLGQALPTRLWGISLISSAIAATGYFIFSRLSLRWAAESVSEGAHANNETEINLSKKFVFGNKVGRLLTTLISFLILPIVTWQIYAWFFSGKISAKSPFQVWHYFFASSGPSAQFGKLISAVPTTLGLAIAGLIISLAAALIFAIVSLLSSNFARLFYPIALVSQTAPIVAWIPVLKLFAGKGPLLTILVTISVSFFPGFVFLSRGLTSIPPGFIDVMKIYNASPFKIIKFVRIPASFPYLVAAFRLTAPRALLGVILAEYLVTSAGLGGLVYDARGTADFRMLWAVAWITAITSGALYVITKRASRGFKGNNPIPA